MVSVKVDPWKQRQDAASGGQDKQRDAVIPFDWRTANVLH